MKPLGHFLALQELEIEKLIEKEDHEKTSSDELYNDIKSDQDLKQSLDIVTGDSEEETQTEITTSNEQHRELLMETSIRTRPGMSTVKLRAVLGLETHNLLKYPKLSFESFEDYDHESNPQQTDHKWASSSSSSVKDLAWSAAKFTGHWLKVLGIHLATNVIPDFSKKAYKGVLYAFDRLAHNFSLGLTTLEQYINRRFNSFSRLYSKIHKCEEALKLLHQTNNEDIGLFRHVDTIRMMVSNNSDNANSNLISLNSFVKQTINDLGYLVREEIKSTEDIVKYSNSKNAEGIYDFLDIPMKIKTLSYGEVLGYKSNSDLVTSFRSSISLPGNVVLIGHFPKNQNQDRDLWIEAYRDSEIILGIDRERLKVFDELPYLNQTDLSKLITNLRLFCLLCIQHQAFYENLRKEKISQKLVYKRYFESLVHRDAKVSLRDSLVDLVTLKNNFLDKVYIPAAIDIHDYSVRVINAYLSYIENNIKALS